MRPFRCPPVLCSHGAIEELARFVGDKTVLLISSAGWLARGLPERVLPCIGGILHIARPAPSHPTINDVLTTAERLPAFDIIVAIGGGSVIDTAKAVLALLRVRGDGEHLRNLLSDPSSLSCAAQIAQLIAIPTTSGTGSEVTPWATIWGENGQKFSLSHPDLLPSAVLLDPTLCVGMPTLVTVASGLDAMSHAMEAVWNVNHTPVSDSAAASAIRALRTALPNVIACPKSLAAREAVQVGALNAGLAMATTQTALAHSISYALTGSLGVPHGLASGITLAEVARFNTITHPGRIALIADAFDTSLGALPDAIYGWLRGLDLHRFLRSYFPEASVPHLDDGLINPDRASNNLRVASEADAAHILTSSLKELLGSSAQPSSAPPGRVLS